jgi:hypothetical protein
MAKATKQGVPYFGTAPSLATAHVQKFSPVFSPPDFISLAEDNSSAASLLLWPDSSVASRV